MDTGSWNHRNLLTLIPFSMPLCTPKDILHNTCVTVSRTDAQWEKLYNIQALHCVLRHCYKTQCYVIGKRNEPAGLHELWCVASGDDCLLLLYWVPDTVFCLSLINFISLNAKFFQQARVLKKKKKKTLPDTFVVRKYWVLSSDLLLMGWENCGGENFSNLCHGQKNELS